MTSLAVGPEQSLAVLRWSHDVLKTADSIHPAGMHKNKNPEKAALTKRIYQMCGKPANVLDLSLKYQKVNK